VSKTKHNSISNKISVDNVSVIYTHRDKQILAVENLSFSVADKEFLCILGPSGCGKSTVLRLIAGFLRPDSGEVRVNGKLVRQPGPDRGVVFQRYNLFPWKRVRQNIEFGLRMKGMPKKQRDEITSHYLEAMGLTEFADSYPYMLSVGMQQRVGLARAYTNDPDVLLMDEPFASLDAQTSDRMRELLLRVWTENRKTVIFITHDIDEAIGLADRVVLFSSRPGQVKESFYIDLPRPRPRDMFADSIYLELRKKITDSIFNNSN
jgi:ABC-type nitrate/sulfonate/bicarbonate transport system ATPase subunit